MGMFTLSRIPPWIWGRRCAMTRGYKMSFSVLLSHLALTRLQERDGKWKEKVAKKQMEVCAMSISQWICRDLLVTGIFHNVSLSYHDEEKVIMRTSWQPNTHTLPPAYTTTERCMKEKMGGGGGNGVEIVTTKGADSKTRGSGEGEREAFWQVLKLWNQIHCWPGSSSGSYVPVMAWILDLMVGSCGLCGSWEPGWWPHCYTGSLWLHKLQTQRWLDTFSTPTLQMNGPLWVFKEQFGSLKQGQQSRVSPKHSHPTSLHSLVHAAFVSAHWSFSIGMENICIAFAFILPVGWNCDEMSLLKFQ